MRLTLNSLLATAALTAFTAPAFAQLSPGPDPLNGPVTTGRTLTTGTGTINSGGSITVSGSTVGVTINGTSTLVNDGTIRQTGSGRAVDSNVKDATVTVINRGLISAVSSDAFRINHADEAVSLTNSGTIQVTNGGQAIDWAAIKSKSNTLMNTATGVITAVGEDAVRMGANGVLTNFGTILATPTGGADPSGSDGVDIRRITGIAVENHGSIKGRHGIATDGDSDSALTLTVHNYAGGVIEAINGSGLNIDGANNNAEAIAAGGGSITNGVTGRIIGSSLLDDAPNGDSTRAGNGILVDNSSGGSAIAVTTITNDGLIQGKTGFGVQIVGTFGDSITNDAGGRIQGAAGVTTIQMGGGADTLINRGAIVNDAGNTGNAVDLQDGDDQFTIEGGSASVVGNISGGTGNNTLKITPGTGQSFTYAGSASNFNTVEVASGTVTLSGTSTYTGTTLLSGGRLVLDGANRLDATSALVLSGGALEVANAGGANGQTFASLELTDSSTIELDSTSLTFGTLSAVASGKTLSIVDWDSAASPDYAIRFVGDLGASAAFLALIGQTTVNGLAAAYYFDGLYTDVKAVPVPAAFGLLMSGLGLLGVFRRRRATA